MEGLFNFLMLLITILIVGIIWDSGFRNQNKERKRLEKMREMNR